MVFKSKNIDRRCKYCDKPPKENIQVVNGKKRRKGYYRTCGSPECVTAQYRDFTVCARKGRPKKPTNYVCYVCENNFQPTSPRHQRYCLECVPDKSWRGRAMRYGVGKKQWDEMLDKQEGTCALCERVPEVVDHCHTSHEVRGLLCSKCNIRVGSIEFFKEKLEKVFDYIGLNYV